MTKSIEQVTERKTLNCLHIEFKKKHTFWYKLQLVSHIFLLYY